MIDDNTMSVPIRQDEKLPCKGGDSQRASAGVYASAASENSAPYLGIYGRTEAGHASRGLQPDTKTQRLLEKVDIETGEIVRYQETKHGHKIHKTAQEARAERYALKSVVNRIFPVSETSKCSRWRVPQQEVKIIKNDEFKKAHYTGLIRCSSVWLCPLCAAKISERRRAELVAAIAAAKAMGWFVYFMTCTIPHGIGDDVKLIKKKMLKAWRRMTTGRAGKQMRKILRFEGTIRVLEVTYGVNGFHPHFHVIIFSNGNFMPSALEQGFYPIWFDACVKCGLPSPSERYGLKVQDGEYAAQYAGKWGLEDEMTKGHMKASRSDKGQTPWDFLRDALKNRSERAERLFRVYASAFKGSRQLYWSNGLKAKLGLTETTDEELVAMEEESCYELAELTPEQWRAVLATRSEAALLDIAERDSSQIESFLQAIEPCGVV